MTATGTGRSRGRGRRGVGVGIAVALGLGLGLGRLGCDECLLCGQDADVFATRLQLGLAPDVTLGSFVLSMFRDHTLVTKWAALALGLGHFSSAALAFVEWGVMTPLLQWLQGGFAYKGFACGLLCKLAQHAAARAEISVELLGHQDVTTAELLKVIDGHSKT